MRNSDYLKTSLPLAGGVILLIVAFIPLLSL